MNKPTIQFLLIACTFLLSCNRTEPPAPLEPVPTENQMRWQEMEYYAFIHFSLNTYTDQSWGYGDEDLNLFNPTELDCRQWARICKDAGMKGIIITAKHHSGFCLWPSEYTEYSVKNTPWKDGKGDVVRELADACKEYGLKMGIYVSPWDRNHAEYGSPEYITYFRNQIRELLTNYGEIFEIWFDGANGGNGYYGGANEVRKIDRKTYYDWQPTYKMIRELQPKIVIWNDNGDRADLRWVGTEEGYVGETNWSLLNSTGDVPFDMLHYGVENGDAWVPGEVNTSIRPEWFYHPSEDDKVKTLPQLMDTYYRSFGHNATLLLNFPVMPNGLIHPNDEKAAIEFANEVEKAFAVNLAENAKAEASAVRGKSKLYSAENVIDGDKNTYWATDDDITNASVMLDFGSSILFNRVVIQEYIRLGQRVKAFTVEVFTNDGWTEVSSATTIGYKRILRFPTVETSKLRITINDAKSCPLISNIGVYQAEPLLNSPEIRRNQKGEISISTDDIGPFFYYTLDGSEPTTTSKKYELPVPTQGKVKVKAIAYDPATGKSSPVGTEKFDICRKDWKIVRIEDEKAAALLDGNPETVWHNNGEGKMPLDLVIDLGSEQNLCGFKYLPDQNKRSAGIITEYEFYTSPDGKKWKLQSKGEFSNIKNNPLWQLRKFETARGRYVKFRALKNTKNDIVAGYAEFDVITE